MQCLVQSNKRKIQKRERLAVSVIMETGLVWSDFNTCKFAVSVNSWLPFELSGRYGSFKAWPIQNNRVPFLLSLFRVSEDSEVLKSGYTSRDLIILENDDPGGIFEFSHNSRGPYIIRVSLNLHFLFITSGKCSSRIWNSVDFSQGRRCCRAPHHSVQGVSGETVPALSRRTQREQWVLRKHGGAGIHTWGARSSDHLALKIGWHARGTRFWISVMLMGQADSISILRIEVFWTLTTRYKKE